MKKNTRREFLRSSTLLASLAAFSAPKFFKDRALLYLTAPTSEGQISLIHTGGLQGTKEGVEKLGGLNAIRSYLQSRSQGPVFLDSGNFINPIHGLTSNLDFLTELVESGLTLSTLGKNELQMSPTDLKLLVEKSGVKILGNALDKYGLVLGSTYYSKAIIRWGKYKVGVLPTRGISLSELNRKALELKLLHQCDIILGLGPVPFSAKLDLLKSKHHEVNHYFCDAEDTFPLGTQVFQSKKQTEFWISKPGEMGKYLGVFDYTINKDYRIHHFNNLSFVPGEAGLNNKMAFLSQSFTNPNQII